MSDVSNLKINERSNVKWPNLPVTKIEIRTKKIDLYQRTNMRIGRIASSAEYRMDERF